ncbi:hypothetical protein [Polaribacter sp. R77954]|uniref:hypothetical protein n=1 Tax=Polaribacter sp. R77954 TaxID=3093870 RepID=UPI0037CA1E95
MKNLNQKKESKGEKFWIIIFQIIGLIIFIAPLYLPILAYFSTSIESIRLSFSDIAIMVLGIFLVKDKDAILLLWMILSIEFLFPLNNSPF